MGNFNQTSFIGGMNLLVADTRLNVISRYKEGNNPYDITFNQYRLGLNLRTRFDVVTPVPGPLVDSHAPDGVKQALVSFGNYLILFCAGKAYYKLYNEINWTQINNFSMSPVAPRYWTVAVPLATTNYGRIATPVNTADNTTAPNAAGPINQVQTAIVAGSFANNPGLLVQDGINQPQFIYIDNNGFPVARITQTYNQWSYPLNATTLQLDGPDLREYVPIGTFMEWFNGILFIVDINQTFIYRSVSGRPLDFVINIDGTGNKGGDATTTSYSIGVSGITALRAMPGNMLFVSAGNSVCFSVTLNLAPNAPTIFGEYTFIRTVLFNASCVTDRGIIDILGDSVFIDSNGLRSFNAVEQQLNEGRNSVFSATVQSLFNGVQQQAPVDISSNINNWCSAINFDNYAIFSVLTTMGYILVVYDTINSVYSAVDTLQLGNHSAKQFASISITTLALFAITDDDRVVRLYADENTFTPTIRLGANSEQDPAKELKVVNVRAIFGDITEDITVVCSLFINDRFIQSMQTTVNYVEPVPIYTGVNLGDDIGTQTNNLIFTFNNAMGNGWKAFAVLTWNTGASLISVSMATTDTTPTNPPMTQAVQQLS